MRTFARTITSLAVFASVLGLLMGVGPGVARAQVSSVPDTYTVSARADGLMVETYVPQAPLIGTGGGMVDVSSASAQALVDSIGRSTAYASAPYPGDIVVGLPGLVNGLGAGELPPVPDYPLYVNSDFPAEPARRGELGPYVLDARSDALESVGSVAIGMSSESLKVGAVNARSEASVDEVTGALVARAWSSVDPIAVGGLLSIGKIETVVRMEMLVGEEPKIEASTDLGTITIAGIKVGITDEGLVLGAPIPGLSIPGATAGLSALLAQAGIDLEVLPAVKTDTSYTSQGLRISYGTEVPVVGETRVSVVVGRATVSVSAAVAPAPADPEAVIDLPAAPVDMGGLLPAQVDGLDLSLPWEVAAAPVTPAGPNVVQPATQIVRSTLDLGTTRFYTSLVIAALVSLAASRALGAFGVRVGARPSVPRPSVRLQLPLD